MLLQEGANGRICKVGKGRPREPESGKCDGRQWKTYRMVTEALHTGSTTLAGHTGGQLGRGYLRMQLGWLITPRELAS